MAIPPRPWSSKGTRILDSKGRTVCVIAVMADVGAAELVNFVIQAANALPEPSPYLCVVCKRNSVAPEMGQDTCDDCLKRI